MVFETSLIGFMLLSKRNIKAFIETTKESINNKMSQVLLVLLNPKKRNIPVAIHTATMEFNLTNLLNSIVARIRKIPKSSKTEWDEYNMQAISSNTYIAPEIALTSVEFIL